MSGQRSNEPERARRSTRISVDIDAVLTTSDGHCCKVIVRDLSAEGFRLELEDEVLVGEQVSLQVGRARALAGQIVWALGREAGGRFLDQVSLDDFH